MRRDRHDVRRAIGQPYTSAGKRYLHHVFRKVTSRMPHVLVRRGDVATSGVVVSAEMRRHTTPFTCCKQQRKIDLSAMIDERLRGRSEERRVGKECRSR